MKNEDWEFIKFATKLQLRYLPRLIIAPYVGAVRHTRQEIGRMDAEFDEYVARWDERAANGQSVADAIRPEPCERPR